MLRTGVGGGEQEDEQRIGIDMRSGGHYVGKRRVGHLEGGVFGGVGQIHSEAGAHHPSLLGHGVVFGSDQQNAAVVAAVCGSVFVLTGQPGGDQAVQSDSAGDDVVQVQGVQDGHQVGEVVEIAGKVEHYGQESVQIHLTGGEDGREDGGGQHGIQRSLGDIVYDGAQDV